MAEELLKQKRLSTASTPEEMLRLTRILRATTDCNQALLHSTDEIELVQKICNIVVDIGGYRMAWIGYAEHDPEKNVRPIAQSGFEEGYLEIVKISWGDTEFGRGPTGTAIRTCKPITSLDIINDPLMKPWHKDAIKRGYASSLSLPLKVGHEVFGALTIYSSNPDAFNEEELKLQTTLAENLAYGITMLRTRRARQKVEEELLSGNERMHFIMQATNAGFWEYEMSTNTNTWSDEVWRLYGLKPNSTDNTYETWISTIIPEDRETVEQAVQEAINKGGDYSCRWRTMDANGTFRWLLSKGSPVKDTNGSIVRYAGLVLDITDQKKKEDALTESEQRFKTLFEQHSSVMLIIDPATGSIIDANRAAADFYGWPVETLKQMRIQQLTTSGAKEVTMQMEDFKTQAQNHRSFSHSLANGSIRDVDVFSCPITFEGKTLLYSIINDITERKLAEQALQSSERKFRSITEQLAEMVFVTDSRGAITYVSPASEHLFDYLPHEMIGHVFTEYTEEEERSIVLELFQDTLLHNLSTRVVEFKCLRKNGSLFDGEVHFQYYHDNESSGTIGLIRDITERKKTYAQLKKMSAAVEQSPAVVVITDPRGNIEYVNPMFTWHTGYSSEEAIGKNPRILQSGLVPKELYSDLWQTILSGKVWHGELQNKKKNGELFWESVVIAAILNAEGVITNFVAVKEDITDQKKMLNDLIKAKEKAEESDRLKSAFLANLSHEIRTPMNGILGFSELLKEPQLSGEEMAEYIDLIQKSGQRMLNLINDLIDISRIDAEEAILQISETPLNELIHNLHAFFQPEAASKGLRLTYKTGLSDTESIIKTDSEKVNQILTNLVNNALKFTRKGGVDFGYTLKNDMLEFYVIDTGIGIPIAMKEKVFDRFRQVDNTLTRGYEGAGLGLSITKALVEILGGNIWVESVEGEGSKFCFTMEYTPAGSSKTSGLTANNYETALPNQDLTILIAEDDDVSTLLLKKSLKGANISIITTENGHEAMQLVKQHPEINLVLMDIKMPVMNGFEATKLIKQQRPDLPIIAQSAFTSKDDKEKATEAGCDAFITKPIKKSELLELMQTLLHPNRHPELP